LNTKFILPIYLEFGKDGLGALPNMDASARYNLQITVAGGSNTAQATGPYMASGTPPGTLPTMTITVEGLFRSKPPATDMFNNQNSVAPPAVGTTQYWTKQTVSSLINGNNTIQLSRVGNIIRNHLLVFRNSTSSANPRGTAETNDLPSLFEFDWDSGQRYVSNVGLLRYINGYGVYGMDVPAGVIALPDTLDPNHLALTENGADWLPTVGATKFTLRFSPGASVSGGNLTVLTNDIVPASGVLYQAPQLTLG
ncbi:MAG TPA: hypothetical protein VFK47_17835, partial [Ktedonobacteraceae bacterium]|nr:hypothetical protein [Ktedonobacteraceae bacterium]